MAGGALRAELTSVEMNAAVMSKNPPLITEAFPPKLPLKRVVDGPPIDPVRVNVPPPPNV